MARTTREKGDVFKFFGRAIAEYTPESEIRVVARTIRAADVGVVVEAMIYLVARNEPAMFEYTKAMLAGVIEKAGKIAAERKAEGSPFVDGLVVAAKAAEAARKDVPKPVPAPVATKK